MWLWVGYELGDKFIMSMSMSAGKQAAWMRWRDGLKRRSIAALAHTLHAAVYSGWHVEDSCYDVELEDTCCAHGSAY